MHVFAILLYPNPTLQEVQFESDPRQVRQLLVQVAQGTVPVEVVPFVQAVHVFEALLNPNPTLQEVHAILLP